MEKRTQKQLLIGLIFILIIGGAAYGLFNYFFLIEASCYDNIKNGQEEGVDCGILACGAACEPEILPLNIIKQKLIEVGPADYDFVAQINNPNSVYGASDVVYELRLNKNNGEIFNKKGSFYILPKQTRMVIIQGIKPDGFAKDSLFKIDRAEWKKINFSENLNFSVKRKSYLEVGKNGIFSEFEGIVSNDSDFDFDKVEAGIVLLDSKGEIVAVNKTDIRTFLSKTERYFKVSWPAKLPASARQDVEINTNVFENSNFIKKYGTQERFQLYY